MLFRSQWTSNQSVTVTDLSGGAQTYSVSISQPSSQVVFSVSPGSLPVPANGSATFTVTLTSNGVTLGTSAFKDFQGDVMVAGSGPTMQLPLWVRFK